MSLENVPEYVTFFRKISYQFFWKIYIIFQVQQVHICVVKYVLIRQFIVTV